MSDSEIRCEDGTVVTIQDYRQMSVGEFEEAVHEGRILPVGRPINEVVEELIAPPTCEEALRERHVSGIRTYVLVFEDGFWEQGNVERRRKAVRAFNAADAVERWKLIPKSLVAAGNGKFRERQRLVDIEPYDPERAEHQDLEIT